MDDKLIRLARKVKTLEDELSHLSQIKDLEGLLVASTEMNNKYKKSINETVGMYKEYISNTKNELQDSMKIILKEYKDYKEKSSDRKEHIDNLENKINRIKDDIQKVCTSIDKSIEDIQKDILKDIKEKNNQILLNLEKKDKELKEVKQENAGLVKDLKALKDLVNKLELQKGDDGKSAYDIACELGFKGTKEEWIKSLHGKDGQDIELRGLRAFSDAPKDNKMYARKNKKWVEVESGGGSSVQSDWNENDSSSMAYIKNKPSGLVTDTDYATTSKAGIIRAGYGLLAPTANGEAYADTFTYATYQNKSNGNFIGKGTLENVITGKELVNQTQLNNRAPAIVVITESDYDALESYADNTEYHIIEG